MSSPSASSRAPLARGSSGRRIAVLGAGGFIGSHLVPALARQGDTVEAVDVTFGKLDEFFSAPPTSATDDARNRVVRVTADVRQPGLLDEVTTRCDVIVSLTALCNPALYNTRPLEVIDANYTDLAPLVELCAVRRRWLVHFSTCEVYGRMALSTDGTPTATMSEDSTGLFLGPIQAERWTYACAKQLLERLIFAHGKHAGLPFTIVRPFNVIGPRMDFVPGIDGEGIPRVLASFMHALMSGGDLLLVDGGTQRRSFISVGDFIDGVLHLLARPAQAQGQIFNLGHPENDVSVRELAGALARVYGTLVPGARPAVLRDVSAAAFYGEGYDDTQARIPDITSARTRLAWEPRTTLDEMLPPIVEDYVSRYAAALAPDARRKAAT